MQRNIVDALGIEGIVPIVAGIFSGDGLRSRIKTLS